MNGSSPVPILGQKAGATAMLAAIPRALDDQGLAEARVVQGSNGQPAVQVDRADYVDASELVALIRQAVREEVERALTTFKEHGG